MSGKHFLSALLASAVAALSVAAAGVSAPSPTFGTGPSTAMEMREHILASLTGKATGFAYAIVKDGQLVVSEGVGKARIPGDGNRNMKPSSRLDVMSVTKTTTAVAVLQLLDELDLPLDSKISKWLPPEWAKGPGFRKGKNGLTFEELLTHRSGLDQAFLELQQKGQEGPWQNNWDGLEFVVANGTHTDRSYAYKNANYALMRIMIPALWRATGDHPGINVINEANVGFWYLAYVQQRVFEPAGVYEVDCFESNDATAVLAYNAQNPQTGSEVVEISPSELDSCGGHGHLHLSALDLAKFMAHLTHGTLLDTPQLQVMDSKRLGWRSSSNKGENAGMYYHGGTGFLGDGRELRSCVAKLPQDIQTTLVVNSNITTGKDPCTILTDAYKKAIA
ncbi:MAG TPA: serine hydrolase domain-containing protein [Gaiella sp.]|nr:serine hydrolase domain-containing protein [Gaiella sp.]